jgi:hypothetical protein
MTRTRFSSTSEGGDLRAVLQFQRVRGRILA